MDGWVTRFSAKSGRPGNTLWLKRDQLLIAFHSGTAVLVFRKQERRFFSSKYLILAHYKVLGGFHCQILISPIYRYIHPIKREQLLILLIAFHSGAAVLVLLDDRPQSPIILVRPSVKTANISIGCWMTNSAHFLNIGQKIVGFNIHVLTSTFNLFPPQVTAALSIIGQMIFALYKKQFSYFNVSFVSHVL